MTGQILIETSPFETRVARFEAGRLEAFHIFPARARLLPGVPVIGRICSIAPALEAGFVDIGEAEDAFLPLSKKQLESAVEGDLVLVSLSHQGTGTKGARLGREISLPGRGMVLLVGGRGVHYSRQFDPDTRARLTDFAKCLEFDRDAFGLIFRTEAAGLDAAALEQGLGALLGEAETLFAARAAARAPGLLLGGEGALALFLRGMSLSGDGIITDNAALAGVLRDEWASVRPDLSLALEAQVSRRLFDEAGVEDEIDGVLSGRIALGSGGEIVVQPTEALTAVDVNTGEGVKVKGVSGNKASRTLQTNLEAADALARVLRMANIGGLVAIDFLKMDRSADEARVLERLKLAVAGDGSAVRIGGFSRLGLCDLSRQRRGPSLFDALVEPGGRARLKTSALAAEAMRLVLRAAEAAPGRTVVATVSGEAFEAITALREAGKGGMMGPLEARVAFEPNAGFARDRIEIAQEG